MAAILVFPFFGREPLYCRFGSWHIWNQHTQKPLCANFHAFLTKCTTHPKFVTYLPHYNKTKWICMALCLIMSWKCNNPFKNIEMNESFKFFFRACYEKKFARLYIHELIFWYKKKLIHDWIHKYFWYEKFIGLFTNWPGIQPNLVWLEIYVGTPFISENGNIRDKQTMFYLKYVSIFRSKLDWNIISVHDALWILFFLYHNFVKTICLLSKWIYACNFVQLSKGLEKILTFKISLKQILISSSVKEYLKYQLALVITSSTDLSLMETL